MAKASIAYIGTDDGLVTVSDPGATGRWRRIGHSLPGQQIIALVARNALHMLAASPGQGVQRSTDGGQSWHPVLTGPVWALAGHPAADHDDTLVVYAATGAGNLHASADSGQSWHPGNSPQRNVLQAGSISHVLATPPATILVAQGSTLWRTHLPATSWEQVGPALPGTIAGVAASPGRENCLLALAQGTLYRTSQPATASAALTWEALPHAASLADLRFYGPLAVLPGREETLLASLVDPDEQPRLARSTDDGTTWQLAELSPDVQGPVTVVMPASYHRDVAWAGTTSGQVLRSDDRGRTWSLVQRDLAAVRSVAAVRLA